MDAYVWEFVLVEFFEQSNLPEFYVMHIFLSYNPCKLSLGVNY